MSNNIAGKIVVITGASSRLGEATARHLSHPQFFVRGSSRESRAPSPSGSGEARREPPGMSSRVDRIKGAQLTGAGLLLRRKARREVAELSWLRRNR